MPNFEENDSQLVADVQQDQQTMNLLNDGVEDLFKFRDYYFETHSLEDAVRKNQDVEEKLKDVIKRLDQNQDSAVRNNKAKFYYLKGRALNVLPDYSKQAEELLSKAVKLDPKLVEAWNELGESYWKNNNTIEAENCFKVALNYSKNKVSLRSLSMVARQKQFKNDEEKRVVVEAGLNFAKEAVQMDPHDGLSWLVLGNSHLSSFFGVIQSPKTLKQCLSAYSQAERDITAKTNPDLHYNKATTLKYEEEYELALESFNLASRYEPSWELPQRKANLLLKYLEDITDFTATCGKMKAKRLQQTLQSIELKQLGPYAGGVYTSTNGQSAKLVEIPFTELKAGLNEEKVILGKVVCSVYNEDEVPFTFCMVSKAGICVAVTVYNIAQSKGVIIGDSIAIPEPYVTDIDFNYKDKEIKFRLIRVETPCVLVVNGKKLSRNNQAGVQMAIFKNFTPNKE